MRADCEEYSQRESRFCRHWAEPEDWNVEPYARVIPIPLSVTPSSGQRQSYERIELIACESVACGHIRLPRIVGRLSSQRSIAISCAQPRTRTFSDTCR